MPVFKQEVPSPTNQAIEILKMPRSPVEQFTVVDRRNLSPGCVRSHQMGTAGGVMNGGVGNIQSNEQQGGANGSSSSSNGLANFLDQFGNGNQGNENNEPNNNGQNPRVHHPTDEYRFQYVLAAATSIATKSNEETLTYLNQGQSYEIKLKKLGDLSSCRGKMMKSVVKICFHERRLQYMEREQMHIWQSSRPGERILDIDIPLSYGLIHVNQTALLNTAEILWDPMKEVGVYIKVNCISTEFTPKKHGGEKGVPFRIQIETYFEGPGEVPVKALHAAACQIKVSSEERFSVKMYFNQIFVFAGLQVKRCWQKAQTRPGENPEASSIGARQISAQLRLYNFKRHRKWQFGAHDHRILQPWVCCP